MLYCVNVKKKKKKKKKRFEKKKKGLKKKNNRLLTRKIGITYHTYLPYLNILSVICGN